MLKKSVLQQLFLGRAASVQIDCLEPVAVAIIVPKQDAAFFPLSSRQEHISAREDGKHSLLVSQGAHNSAKHHGRAKACDEQPADVLDRETVVLIQRVNIRPLQPISHCKERGRGRFCVLINDEVMRSCASCLQSHTSPTHRDVNALTHHEGVDDHVGGHVALVRVHIGSCAGRHTALLGEEEQRTCVSGGGSVTSGHEWGVACTHDS